MFKSLFFLKVLQEVDFFGMSDQIKVMSNFYFKLNEVMVDLFDLLEDIKQYKEQFNVFNQNIGQLNGIYVQLNNVYGNVIFVMFNVGK